MGDRANVVVREGANNVFLYTHSGGSELPDVLRTALRRGKDRWDDPSYLARIVFCDMVRGAEDGTTGAGISARFGDNDGYPLLVCDTDTKEVVLETEEGVEVDRMSMEAYCEIGGGVGELTWLALRPTAKVS